MSEFSFDHYYNYEELTRFLHYIADKYPNLVHCESIGQSFEGRDIWLITVTNFASGDDHNKPGFWVDGNIHANELTGSMACLYLINSLVDQYGTDTDTSRCLDTRTFYICPQVNPDGANQVLSNSPKLLRSNTSSSPLYQSEFNSGAKLVNQDVDGDGRILSMRIPDPDGSWKVSDEEPRLLVSREPSETGGQYYRLLPEGIIQDYDGSLIKLKTECAGVDLNRNFPAGWRQECDQKGAGDYPLSESEGRLIIDFIVKHPNICGGVSFHTFGGILLRPPSGQADDVLPPEDLWVYQEIGAKGEEITGYSHGSVYKQFRQHANDLTTGAFDDWLYEHHGVFAWTVEIWSPQFQAGITDYHYVDWYRKHSFNDDLKLLKWSDAAMDGNGYIEWYEFEHPQLGKIELGGWNTLYTFMNPPNNYLKQEIARFPKWLVWHNLISPKLEMDDANVEKLGDNLYQISVIVRNIGWLPSYITKSSLRKKLCRDCVVEIELPFNGRLVSGERAQELGQLEGRAYHGTSMIKLTETLVEHADNSAKAEWVIYAPSGGKIVIKGRHERAGIACIELNL